MDKILSAIQHTWVVVITAILTIVSVVIPGHKNLPLPSPTPTPLVEQVATPSASPLNKQPFIQPPKKVLGTNTQQAQSDKIKQNQPTQSPQQTTSNQPTTQTVIVYVTPSPTPTQSTAPTYSYKPCCTSPSGEQINLEPSVDCLSYGFSGKSYDLGQIAQKIKDSTGVKLMAESPNNENISEANGSMNGNSAGITIMLYKTDAYDYSNFRPDYPGAKVAYHYIPVACTDDLKQKFTSTLDSYKTTLP